MTAELHVLDMPAQHTHTPPGEPNAQCRHDKLAGKCSYNIYTNAQFCVELEGRGLFPARMGHFQMQLLCTAPSSPKGDSDVVSPTPNFEQWRQECNTYPT